jgi:hypothetical protein
MIPNIDKRIHYVIAGVIFLSLLPAIISVLRARFSAEPKPAPAARRVTPERD